MKVAIKSFGVGLEIKNNGIEIEVKDTYGKQRGDLVITKSQVIWCPGRTRLANGISVKWEDFIQLMQSRRSK